MKASLESMRTMRVGKESESFKRAALAFTKKAVATPKTANKKLVDMGIYTIRGALTKTYR